jgi:hypothetical protein
MTSNAVTAQANAQRLPAIAVVVRVLVVFDIVALLFAAALHVQGVHIPLGSMVFEEPQIVPAAVVEGLAGGLFAVAAYTVFAGRRGAWLWTFVAHVFAILILLLGILARRTETSTFNYVSHLVVLGVFVIGLALLLTPAARIALRRGNRRK